MKRDNPYVSWGVTAVAVVCSILLFYDIVFRGSIVLTYGTMFLQILAPVLYGAGVITAAVVIATYLSGAFVREGYQRGVYKYALAFGNFGFMGNAVVKALYEDLFFEYLIFVIPLWILIYMWGVPVLLISDGNKGQSAKSRLRSFVNPMFICMIIGMLIPDCKASTG